MFFFNLRKKVNTIREKNIPGHKKFFCMAAISNNFSKYWKASMPFHILQNTLAVWNAKQDSNIFPWHKSSPSRIVRYWSLTTLFNWNIDTSQTWRKLGLYFLFTFSTYFNFKSWMLVNILDSPKCEYFHISNFRSGKLFLYIYL